MFQRVCMRIRAYLLAAFSVLAAPGCRSGAPPDSQGVAPELRLDGVRFRVYRDDGLRAIGEAEVASLRRDSSELKARNVDATLPRGVAPPLRFTAPSGEGSLLSRVFHATGGVVVARGDDAARTASARYEPGDGDGVVEGDEPVVVEGRGYKLDGTGFTLDPTEGTIVVRGRAKLVAGLPGAR